MVYADGGSARTRMVRHLRGRAPAPSCSTTPRSSRWPAGPWPSNSTTAGRWTWSGPRTARPASCSSSRPGRRRCSRAARAAVHRPTTCRRRASVLAAGAAVGDAIAQRHGVRDPGAAADIDKFRDGAILVTEMTDPDWVPIMKRAAGIVTDHGGPTSHAAIVSRELGVPAVVGTGNATARPGATGRTSRSPAPRAMRAASTRARLPFETEEVDLGDAAGDAHRDHGQHRQPRRGLPLVAAAGRRRRACPDGVHHQQPDPGPSDGAGPPRAGHGRRRRASRSER